MSIDEGIKPFRAAEPRAHAAASPLENAIGIPLEPARAPRAAGQRRSR